MTPLFAVRAQLRAAGPATATQLAAALSLPRATVEDVLAHWQRRGQVETLTPGTTSTGCAAPCAKQACPGCAPAAIYAWHGPPAGPPS